MGRATRRGTGRRELLQEPLLWFLRKVGKQAWGWLVEIMWAGCYAEDLSLFFFGLGVTRANGWWLGV